MLFLWHMSHETWVSYIGDNVWHIIQIHLVLGAQRGKTGGQNEDKDQDLELVDNSFSLASNITEMELASLYYISGYVTYKGNLEKDLDKSSSELPTESEFTTMLSRGKLKYPPDDIYDLSKYLYTFFKASKPKCCSKIFLQGFCHIYIWMHWLLSWE